MDFTTAPSASLQAKVEMHLLFQKKTEERLLFWIKKTASSLLPAAEYALQSGGKRMRPILLLSLCYDSNYPWEKALDLAAAIEAVHIYSLIHDDLPSMDNDDERRGFPTLHRKFSESTAILTGDYFLTLSFHILSRCDITPSKKEKIIQLFASRSGGKGMIEGQFLDLLAEKEKPLSILPIPIKKTAALLSAALESASILADFSPSQIFLIRKLALSFGISFQLLDDQLDKIEDKKGWKNSWNFLGDLKAEKMLQKYLKRVEKYSSFFPNNGMMKQSIKLFLQTKKELAV